MKIDVHSHITTQQVIGAAGRHGPEYSVDDEGRGYLRIGEIRRPIETREVQERGRGKSAAERAAIFQEWLDRKSDPDIRLAEMDAKGIDVMGVTGSPLMYYYWIEEEVAIPFAQSQNDGLAKFCSRDPQRLFFQATLPLQNVEVSVAEAERAVRELGAKGINIGAANLAGRELYDEELWPLFETVERLGVPLYIHPYPVELAAGVTDRYSRTVLDYPYQETLAFTNLVYGGVLDDFPDLSVYLTHGGGFLPYQFGRIETFAAVKQDVRAKRPIESYLGNFFFDILVHELQARRYLVEWAGIDNLVVGDNFLGLDSADGFAFVDELGLPDEDAEKLRWKNAARLFHLDLPTTGDHGHDHEGRTS